MNKKKINEFPKPKADLLFELSWEVCNKVGGIYTVITSKAETATSYYKDYYLIGPYFPENADGEFKEEKAPKQIQSIFDEMKEKGINCYFGKWLIRGEPNVILIDFKNWWDNLNKIKTEFWESFQLDSINASHDWEEPLIWSYLTGIFLEKANLKFKNKNMVAHFHEWLCGGGLLYLKQNKVNLNNVFTTHATALGRSMATAGIDFYNSIEKIDADKKAKELNIVPKYQIEKLMAQNCDVLTTVSGITGIEVKNFLKREPDQLVPNGINMGEYPGFNEITKELEIKRNYLKEFLMYYFFPYYFLDISKTLFYFIAGRYETKVKGIDLTIKSLAKLNQKLIKEKSDKNIVTFIFVPANSGGIKAQIWENKEFFEDIKDSLYESFGKVKSKLLNSLMEGKKVSKEALFNKNFLLEIEKKVLRLKREGNPPVISHNLYNAEQDEILKLLQKNNLNNKEEDKVKVVFYPVYLTGHDGLLNLNYHESIQACDFGIFPSFYEPWGYTPVETIASGVPAVTSDLAGFGKFCQNHYEEERGVFIVERLNKKEDDSINQLSDIFYNFSKIKPRERMKNRIKAREIAEDTDWKKLFSRYILAHNKSLKHKEK